MLISSCKYRFLKVLKFPVKKNITYDSFRLKGNDRKSLLSSKTAMSSDSSEETSPINKL